MPRQATVGPLLRFDSDVIVDVVDVAVYFLII